MLSFNNFDKACNNYIEILFSNFLIFNIFTMDKNIYVVFREWNYFFSEFSYSSMPRFELIIYQN